MSRDNQQPKPRVAVILPIYGQPGLAFEAIESALRQQTSFDYRLVLINDGCRFAETHTLCRSYVCAYPDRVVYLHRKNGGPSAARNDGIRLALDSWPSVEAVYFLDSDNRIRPHLLDRAFALLQQHPEAGWVFPDVVAFGSDRRCIEMAGEFSVLEMLQQNYCDTGSMVRRSVFQAGVAFDEERRIGFEDWDFWLQAIEAGFRGLHGGRLGFSYRRRPESRLRDNLRDDAENRAYIRRKHPGLLALRLAIELEQAEHPRFAIHLADEERTILTADPAEDAGEISTKGFAELLLRRSEEQTLYPDPPLAAMTTRPALRALVEAGVAPGVFWQAQQLLETNDVVLVRVECEPDVEVRVAWDRIDSNSPQSFRAGVSLLMLRTRLLIDALANAADVRLPSLLSGSAKLRVAERRITLARAGEAPSFPNQATQDLMRFLEEFGPLHRRAPRVPGDPRTLDGRPFKDAELLISRAHKAGPTFPHLLSRERLQVGWALPISEFGGVDRVVHNLGRASREYGWDPHLFVIGRSRGRMMREFQDTFQTITIVPTDEHADPERLAGLLGGLDLVVNNHCALLNPVMGELRRLGVLTFAQLHVVDLSPDGFPTGVPYQTLDFENALDGVLVISEAMRRWCLAWGIPGDKLIHVPNAGSFEVSEARQSLALRERNRRDRSAPLRVLYIGRFDRQKGLDRLVQLAQRAQEAGLPVEWRIVGKEILADADQAGWNLGAIRPYMHPPALTASGLAGHYAWADVMVLVSRFEGVPLTILEAQRLGCVVLSTNVGAISELIEEGGTGFLFSNDLDSGSLADAMVSRLAGLHEDRSGLLAVAERSVRQSRNQTWTKSFAPFARHVETLLAAKGAH